MADKCMKKEETIEQIEKRARKRQGRYGNLRMKLWMS